MQNVFRIRAQAVRACFIPIPYYNHLTCHISRCSCTHLTSYSGRHLLQIFKYSNVLGQVHAILQTTTWYWVVTFTPFFRVSIWHSARGNVTDVHVVALYGFTIVGEPQEESSPVHNFLLATTVILHHIGWYPVRHTGHHRMQITTPPVLELPPLSSEGIYSYQYVVRWSQFYGPYLTVVQPLLPLSLLYGTVLRDHQ